MFGKATRWGIVALVATGLWTTGCHKKHKKEFDCSAIPKRIKECNEKLRESAINKALNEAKPRLTELSPEERKTERDLVAKNAASKAELEMSVYSGDLFEKACRKLAKTKKTDALQACLKKSSCEDFMACIQEGSLVMFGLEKAVLSPGQAPSPSRSPRRTEVSPSSR